MLALDHHLGKIAPDAQQPLREYVADVLQGDLHHPFLGNGMAVGQKKPAPIQGLHDLVPGESRSPGQKKPPDVHAAALAQPAQIGQGSGQLGI